MRWMIGLLLATFLAGCSNFNGDAVGEASGQLSQTELDSDANYKDGVYVNNHLEHPDKSFFSFIKMRFFGEDVWHDPESQKHLIPQTKADLKSIEKPLTSQVTWLGHSTFLIQHQGLTVLTDPVFSDRASPVSFAGPKRYTPVASRLSDLPPIDIVLISHNHYDHLDEASVKALGNAPIYYVPSNLTPWFMAAGIKPDRVVALRWWQQATLTSGEGVVTATPSQHWSARGLSDRNRTHWASWLLELQGLTLWFGGDTGYNDQDFVQIGEYVAAQGKPLDVALIPIGAYAPRLFMKPYHVNTQEAVHIHHDLKASLSLGMHWGTFPLTAEPPMEPYQWLNRIRAEGGIKEGTAFKTLKIGETYRVQ